MRRQFAALWVGAVLLCAFSCATQERSEAKTEEQSGDLSVLTFNLRYGTADDGVNRWANRIELAHEVIRDHAPDVLAVQEALDFQADGLIERFPQFAKLGSHRGGGREDEFCGLLVDTREVEVIEQGEFWLSESPNEPGSLGWDAACTRMCVWALLERAGQRFAVYATHFDHRGARARLESAKRIAKDIASRFPRTPVLVCGDFNASEDSNCLATLYATGLRDSFRLRHPEAAEVGTFHGFRGGVDGPKIDAILASSEWTVLEASIDRRRSDAVYPSDHNPVFARLSLP